MMLYTRAHVYTIYVETLLISAATVSTVNHSQHQSKSYPGLKLDH